MCTTRALWAVLGLSALLVPAGCEGFKNPFASKEQSAADKAADAKVVVPAHVAGTVAEHARLIGGGELIVQGYGVVVGLGKNGSSEIPGHLKNYLTQQLAKHHLGSYRHGMKGLSPDRMLRDPDTAIVLVAGVIPPGAPKGSRFDMAVSAMRQTATRSLDGGVLMPVDLHLAVAGTAMPGGPSKPLATGGGEVFVNPFLNPDSSQDLPKYRRGRVPEGGTVLESRRILLRLRQGDYALCDMIQRRINGRFPVPGMRVANAQNRETIEIEIPPQYASDYSHFLTLIMHLPVRGGPEGGEAHAQAIAKAMELPTANHDELALVWEATGRQIIPIIRPLYSSSNPLAALYSARTGLRLGDDLAEEVILRFATTPNSPLQIAAIRELGEHRKVYRAAKVLEEMLHDTNELVRIAAYEALLKRGDSLAISRLDVAGKFHLDLVESRRDYVIYATQGGEPRIVLFGKNMTISRPIFFLTPGELVSINANTDRDKLSVRRKVPQTGLVSDPARIDPYVRVLIEVLGRRPDVVTSQPDEPTSSPSSRPAPKVHEATGLGLTYGQVVSVLQRLCKENDIHARFVLQEISEADTIYDPAVTSGRPDMPGS